MKNILIIGLISALSFSLTLNVLLWQEMNLFRTQINNMIMPVTDDGLEKLMEEIKNLSNTDINEGNDT
jgi:hypothetical protein